MGVEVQPRPLTHGHHQGLSRCLSKQQEVVDGMRMCMYDVPVYNPAPIGHFRVHML